MVRTLLLIVTIPAAALLAFLALGRPAPPADLTTTADEPNTLDPHRVSWLAEIQLALAMFEGLMRYDPQTLRPEPGVALDFPEVSADQLTYTFTLRPEARWSNGAPVTAADFRYAWLRVLDRYVEAQYATLLYIIRGAREYHRARLTDDPSDDLPPETVGLAVLDDHHLRIVLAQPCPYLLDLLAFPTLAPVYPPLIEHYARDRATARQQRHLWLRPGRIICNGAFVLDQWEFKKALRLRRNEHYWDRATIAIDSIEVLINADPNVRLMAYETGRADLVRDLATPVVRKLVEEQQRGRRHDVHVGDRFATYFFRVNVTRPPLANADFRAALSLAIDREAICTQVMGVGETPADTYVPRGALPLMARRDGDGREIFYEPPAGLGAGRSYEQRVELARERLRHAGLADTASVRPIELAYAPHPDQQRIAEAVQSMWERALGLRVELRVLENKVLRERIRQLDYDVVRSEWFGDYLDPNTFLEMYTSTSGQNRTGWRSARYDELIERANASASNAERYALFRTAEALLSEQELPIIPLFFERGNFLLNPRIEGIHDNVRGLLMLHRVRPAE